MKASKFSDAQKAFILKQGATVRLSLSVVMVSSVM